MAETAVGLVINRLIPLLTEEAHLLRGVHEEVEDIKCDLEFLMAFLKDADTRAEKDQMTNNSHVIKLWVQKLRREAFELEDVIDEYTHLMAKQQRPYGDRFIGFLHRSACLIIKLKPRHDIASKIKDIKQRVQEINKNSATYGLINSASEGSTIDANSNKWYDPRKESVVLKETEVVGIEAARGELIAMVQDESPQCNVISLVGMGGIGKTTLAHQVYVRVKRYFDCHAWIEVSKTYNNLELLRNLLRKFCQTSEESIPEGIDVMNESIVTTKLRDHLQGKRYFVVFDDVWNSSFWADIKNALPCYDDKSGRIMITTRDVNVANFCKQSSFVYVHHLQPLLLDIAWELFCKRAFRYDSQGHCPASLEMLSREILERCKGLPLAIVVIAGVLSTKNKSVGEWRKLLSSLSSELEHNEHLASIEKILALSYNDLPYYLQSCFLYFGIFPEDYSIRCRRLIRQWISEGFVKPKKDKTIEVVAEEYLEELICRSLVQVSEIEIDGKPRRCHVHDLLRDVAMKKMEDLHFCQVLSRSDPKFQGLARRVSVLHIYDDVFKNFSTASRVRSLFMLFEGEMPNSLVSTIPTKFKLLKVLDFEDAPSLDHLPNDIGNLFHLSYLSVRGTQVQYLPKSIGKLENLETLDLKESLVYELPVQINRLRKLRHLLAYKIDGRKRWNITSVRGLKVKNGIGMLKALQKIYFIEANSAGDFVLRELSELTELRKLGIKKLRSEDGKTLCCSIQKMQHLESLDISSTSENEILDLESMSSSPRFLYRLHLKGQLRKIPEWIIELSNLVILRIWWSKLEDDPLNALQNLPNLLELGIYYDAYYGEKLYFEEGAFPQLKVLYLQRLSRLNSIVIEEGALCNLEEFYIGTCPQVKEVPSGFQHLKKLKLLRFFEMPTHFLMFQNFQYLQTIPEVRFVFDMSGKHSFLDLQSIFELQKYIQEHNDVDWNSLPFEQVMTRIFKRRDQIHGQRKERRTSTMKFFRHAKESILETVKDKQFAII